MKISEVINHGIFPVISETFLQSLISKAAFVTQVRPTVALIKNDKYYLLVRNESEVLGTVVIGPPVGILHQTYVPVVMIYVCKAYRKTSAAHWLIFSVKEEIKLPLFVDGAIFKDGGELILALLKHQSIRASVLNKSTGQISSLTHLINAPNSAYVFEQTQLGYSVDYFENNSPVWLTTFEDIDTI